MVQTDLELSGIKKCMRGDTTTLYWRLGTPVLRRRRNRNASGSNWKRTPGRERAVNKFTASKRLLTGFLLVLGEHSPWRRAARLFGRNGQTGENFFFSRNYACIAADGSGVEDFRHFKLSEGRLPLPPGIRLSREGNTCTLAWDVPDALPAASAGDRLQVGVIHDTEPDGLSLADTGDARRGDGKAVFTLDPARGACVHVYPFFSREDNSDFSGNDYFESREDLPDFSANPTSGSPIPEPKEPRIELPFRAAALEDVLSRDYVVRQDYRRIHLPGYLLREAGTRFARYMLHGCHKPRSPSARNVSSAIIAGTLRFPFSINT